MKTTATVTTILYQLISASSLAAAITGKVRKGQRPANSEKEDIVINCLPIDNEPLQRCVVNVNIYVPPYRVKENGMETDEPDFARLETLQSIAASFFRNITKAQDYDIDWEQMSGVMKDEASKSFFFNIRLKFQAFNIQ